MTGTFSWKRGLLHAGVLLGIFLVAGVAVAVSPLVADPEKFGEGMGQFALLVLAAGFGASYLAQTGKRTAAWLVDVAPIALFALIVVGAGLSKPRVNDKLGPAERLALQAVDDGGQRRLRHPLLGFSILHPGAGFTESPDFAAMMGSGRDTQMYAFAESPPQAVLIVGLVKGPGGTRAALAEFVDGVTSGLRKAAREKGEVSVKESEHQVIWEGERREARIHLEAADFHARLRAYPLAAGGTSYVVIVLVISPEAETLADVLASYRPPGR